MYQSRGSNLFQTIQSELLTTSSSALDNEQLQEALENIVDEAISKRVKSVEIIPGKGSGQLMKRVKKFLDQKHIKQTYKRVEIDTKNHGRLFVHFR